MSTDGRLSQSVFSSVHQWFKGLEQNRRKLERSGSILGYSSLSSRARGTRAWRSGEMDCFVAALLLHELKFVIAKEARRLRQSTEEVRWIATSLRSSR
jgi:hypothetical protein